MVVWVLLCANSPDLVLYAQGSNKISMAEEIQSIEKKLKNSKLPEEERHALLIQQAKLFQLTGDIEKAAQTWNDAAFAESGKRDDAALIEGAFCFFAMGELEDADTSVKAILLNGKDDAVLLKTRYLSAQLEAFRSGDIAALIELTKNSKYEQYKAAMYYTLWKISGTDTYKTKLLAEYPLSPEAHIVKEMNSNKGVVKAYPSAMWLLFPGHSMALETPAESSVPVTKNAAPENTNAIAVLQTGVFSREENAKEMVARLKAAGFEGIIKEREVKGTKYWAVTVSPGTDIKWTVAQLQAKGFDSFPVF